jgi:hypothetical protein
MSSTQLKKSRSWNSIIRSYTAKHPTTGETITLPIFNRSYMLSTVPESNDQGDWFGWKIEAGNIISPKTDEFKQAKKLSADVKMEKITSSATQLQIASRGGEEVDDKIPY